MTTKGWAKRLSAFAGTAVLMAQPLFCAHAATADAGRPVTAMLAGIVASAPQTGDTTNVKPWLFVAILAAAALVALGIWSSKSGKKK